MKPLDEDDDEDEGLEPTFDDKSGRVVIHHLGASVGVATVQVSVIELTLEPSKTGPARVTERRLLSRRPPVATPYLKDGALDMGALAFQILENGAASPVLGDDLDGRVAALSGLAADERNAYWVGRALADIDYGKYLCLRAGPHLGAVLAAYGGDAVAHSAGTPGPSRTILNVDLGASTAKLALCQSGEVLETTAIGVGTRLVVFDSKGAIATIRPAAGRVAENAGLAIAAGQKLSSAEEQRLAAALVNCLLNVIHRQPLAPLTEGLMYGPPLSYTDTIDAVSFTGGGAEYLFENQERGFGDLGPALGDELRRRLPDLGIPVQQPENLILATLLGGIQYQFTEPGGAPVYSEPPSFAAARGRDAGFVGS